MRVIVSALALGVFVFVGFGSSAYAIDWIGGTSSDAFDATNWGGGVMPGVGDFVELRNGGSANDQLNLGSADVEWGNVLFNHADDGMVVNGSGTITANVAGGGTSVDIKGIESQGGERVSTIYPNVITNGVIEVRNGHDLVFEGEVTAHTLHAYETSDIIFNGPFNHTGANNGGDLFTGTGTVTFNSDFLLQRPDGGGFGVRNGMTAVIGANAFLGRFEFGNFFSGLGGVNLYSNGTLRVEGDYLIGADTDLFSRYGGPGSGHDPTNTFDLNGYSDDVELLGTHPGANFVINFGETEGANSLVWGTSHHMPGTYEIINFEVGLDILALGNLGTDWWTAIDIETSGGGSPDIEEKKAQITVNGLPYAAFDAEKTEAYWTLVDPSVSREIEIFNYTAPTDPDADFDADTDIDGSDFLTWQRGNGLTGQTDNSNGDADFSGTVDGDDLALWLAGYGNEGAGVSAISSVPEPATMSLVMFGLIGVAGICRRQARG